MAQLYVCFNWEIFGVADMELGWAFLPRAVRYHAYGILEYPLRGWVA
jgi:hypothetical protein